MHTMIILTKDEVEVNEDNQFVLDTHRCNPFPTNQGHLTFPAKGSDLIRCLEKDEVGNSVRVHFVLKHKPYWDYAATMSLQNYQLYKTEDINPKLYPKTIDDINPEKKYNVTCYGGTGYVFIMSPEDMPI